MKQIMSFLAVFALIVFVFFEPAHAQDPTQVGPEVYKTIFENDYVRIFEVHFKPGVKIGTHSHPDHLAYVLSDGKLKLIYPDTAVVIEAKAGATFWIPAESHAAENFGDTDLRVLVLDLKLPKSEQPMSAAFDSTLDPIKVSPKNYIVLLENDRVRLLKVHYEPGDKSSLHAHRAMVAYTLTNGTVQHTSKTGESSELKLTAGMAIWRDAEVHSSVNPDTTAFSVLLAELKEPLPMPQPARKH